MGYQSYLNLCLSPATSLGGSDASAAKALATNKLRLNRINFGLAGYGLLAGGSLSVPTPGVISTSASKSTSLAISASKSTSITMELLGG